MAQAHTTTPDMPRLLRGVSRSFGLSIRLLPTALRQPISVAYLLARATDTIADTAGIPAPQRRDSLCKLAGAIEGTADPSAVTSGLSIAFAPQQRDEKERDLIIALPYCLRWLDALPSDDRDSIRAVLRHITRGQALDLERFGDGATLRALETAAQLDEYTYLVAGCVGEFWTELCLRHLPGFARAPQERMREWGRAYGMGLQLVNILRDAGADLAAGRCYFPTDELAAAGLEPQDIALHPDRFAPVRARWQDKAQERLALGMRYADAVNNRRVRAASALPALLGARTLALLGEAGAGALGRTVKMPRSEVRWIMARLALTLAGRAPLQAQFARLGGGAPADGWDNRAQ